MCMDILGVDVGGGVVGTYWGSQVDVALIHGMWRCGNGGYFCGGT